METYCENLAEQRAAERRRLATVARDAVRDFYLNTDCDDQIIELAIEHLCREAV
jgi:hypothetical protein